MPKQLFYYIFFLLTFFTACDNSEIITEHEVIYGDPYHIQSLVEIVDNLEWNRTGEILDCKLDDLFFFNGSVGALRINPSNSLCGQQDETIVYGNWERKDSTLLDNQVMSMLFTEKYVLHDSLMFGHLSADMTQEYEIIQIEESLLRIQNHNNFSFPPTNNRWLLTLSR